MPPLSVTNAPLPNQQDAIQPQQIQGNAPAALQNSRTGHSAGRVLARIAIAMLTLGISEGIRAIVKLARAARPEETPPPRVNPQPARNEAQPAPQAGAPLSRQEIVEVGRIAIAEGFTLEEFMENCAGLPEQDLQFVRNALAEGARTEGQARPELPEHLQDAVQNARDFMQAANLSLDEVMAQMTHLSAADAALVRAELEAVHTATPQPAPQAGAPLSRQEIVEVGRIAIAEGFTLEEFMENCAGLPEQDLQFVRNALAEGARTEGQARPELPEHLQEAVQNARDFMQVANLSLDEVMAQMTHLSAADAALVRAELAPAQTAAPQTGLAAGIAVRSQADLIAFIRTIARAQLGQAVPVGQAATSTGLPATLHHYDGIVFRADGRSFETIRDAGGMHSKNDLSKAENLLEAQGLAYDKGAGATGQSGVSTAKKIEGAIAYYQGGAFYIIDTRQLGNGRYAYDMEANLRSTNHPRPHEVGGEVNVTDIPMRAIMGCIQLKTTAIAILSNEPSNDAKITMLLQFIESDASVVKFNPEYDPR